MSLPLRQAARLQQTECPRCSAPWRLIGRCTHRRPPPRPPRPHRPRPANPLPLPPRGRRPPPVPHRPQLLRSQSSLLIRTGRRFGTDLTNMSPQSRTTEQKRNLVEQYRALPKTEWLAQRRLDFPSMSHWKKELEERAALPKSERPNRRRRRAPGAGRKPTLSEAVELEIFNWVYAQRRRTAPDFFCHIVTVSQLLIKASALRCSAGTRRPARSRRGGARAQRPATASLSSSPAASAPSFCAPR